MPFANINFSELIKAAISFPPSCFVSVYLYFSRISSRPTTSTIDNDSVIVIADVSSVGITRNACGYTLPPTRYMLAVISSASCVVPRAKLAFSWLLWPSWYSAGIGIKTRSSSATCVTIPRSLPPIATLALSPFNYHRLSLSFSLSDSFPAYFSHCLSVSLVTRMIRSTPRVFTPSCSFVHRRSATNYSLLTFVPVCLPSPLVRPLSVSLFSRGRRGGVSLFLFALSPSSSVSPSF